MSTGEPEGSAGEDPSGTLPLPAWGHPSEPDPTAPVWPSPQPAPASQVWPPPQPAPASQVWPPPQPGLAPSAPWGSHGYSPPGSPPPRRAGRGPLLVGGLVVVLLVALIGSGLAIWRPWASDDETGSPVGAPAGGSAPSATSTPSTGSTGSAAPTAPGGDATTSAPPSATGPTAGGQAQSATAWLASANAYCRSTTDPALKRIQPGADADPATYLTRSAAINRELDSYLRGSAPSSLRRDVTTIADDWDRMAALFDKAAAAIRTGDARQASMLATQAEAANEAGNAVAQRVGLPDCADAGGIGSTPGPSFTSA